MLGNLSSPQASTQWSLSSLGPDGMHVRSGAGADELGLPAKPISAGQDDEATPTEPARGPW